MIDPELQYFYFKLFLLLAYYAKIHAFQMFQILKLYFL